MHFTRSSHTFNSKLILHDLEVTILSDEWNNITKVTAKPNEQLHTDFVTTCLLLFLCSEEGNAREIHCIPSMCGAFTCLCLV